MAGLIPRYREEKFGLARLTLLLPSQRAIRTVTEAFVRASGPGLLLPRMAVVGDLDLDETLGPLLDPIGAGLDIPEAVDPTYRLLQLAAILRGAQGHEELGAAALLRQARGIAQSIDRLLVEGVQPEDMLADAVLGLSSELSEHWRESTALFATAFFKWKDHLATSARSMRRSGEIGSSPTQH